MVIGSVHHVVVEYAVKATLKIQNSLRTKMFYHVISVSGYVSFSFNLSILLILSISVIE